MTNKDNDKTNVFWDNFEAWIAYWRANPHRFVEDYFGLRLHTFQKIALYQMANGESFYFWASRGIGKTWLCGVFAMVLAVLYPGIKIRVASASLRQSIQFIDKIREISNSNEQFKAEILDITSNKEEGEIILHNGSTISTVVSNDNARGKQKNGVK